MCLPMKVKHPQNVLAEGHHAGYEWAVVHNGMGYRCGYVKVEPGHPWHGKGYNDIECEVHGGLTFASPDVPCDKDGPDSGYWVGFDCGHHNDAPDFSLPWDREDSKKYFMTEMPHFGYATIRDTPYVKAECERLCEQAAAAA